MINFSATEVPILQYQKLQDNPKHIMCLGFFSYAINDNNKGSVQLLKKQAECKRLKYFIEGFNNFLSREAQVQT